MVLYDIAKTQKIMADSRSDKELTENLFQISKKIVKEFAEDYQIIDNETKLLVDHILEFNMPDCANPLQKWHEIYDPKIDLHINEFTGEKLPPSPKSIANAPKGNSKTVKALQIFKSVNLAKNAIKSVKQPTRNRSTLKFKTSTHNLKMIDDSIIKKAIEETDCNLNLNKSEKEKKKVVLDNITILQYVAKCFALLGRKVKTSMNKHKKKTDFFAEPVIMPISMKPKIIIENYEITNKSRAIRRSLRRKESKDIKDYLRKSTFH